MSTIRDVARIAKVSITTVSATLNGTAPVSEDLQKRVWAAVEEAGYHPDPVARNLRKGSSTTVGLIVPDIATPWAAHMAKAMQAAFSRHGYNMLLASNEDDAERELREIEVFSAHRVAGLIIAPISHGENYAERLLKAIRTPAVMVDRLIAASRFDTVADDNRLGAQLVTRYLLTLGHRDIAFLAGRAGISPSDERLLGFRETMAAAGMSVREDLVRPAMYRYEHAFSTVQQLMTLASPPTAIACINIAQLLGTMAGLKNMGLRVPQDVSVISFDGFHPAEGWSPSITALDQDVKSISASAAELLMARISGQETGEPRLVRIPPRLQVRESCRAVGT